MAYILKFSGQSKSGQRGQRFHALEEGAVILEALGAPQQRNGEILEGAVLNEAIAGNRKVFDAADNLLRRDLRKVIFKEILKRL